MADKLPRNTTLTGPTLWTRLYSLLICPSSTCFLLSEHGLLVPRMARKRYLCQTTYSVTKTRMGMISWQRISAHIMPFQFILCCWLSTLCTGQKFRPGAYLSRPGPARQRRPMGRPGLARDHNPMAQAQHRSL